MSPDLPFYEKLKNDPQSELMKKALAAEFPNSYDNFLVELKPKGKDSQSYYGIMSPSLSVRGSGNIIIPAHLTGNTFTSDERKLASLFKKNDHAFSNVPSEEKPQKLGLKIGKNNDLNCTWCGIGNSYYLHIERHLWSHKNPGREMPFHSTHTDLAQSAVGLSNYVGKQLNMDINFLSFEEELDKIKHSSTVK